MEFLGDLERAFAAAIYPNRGPIAIIGVLFIVGLAYVGWRRRWQDPGGPQAYAWRCGGHPRTEVRPKKRGRVFPVRQLIE
jgi:hypothetical protein